jgi:signal transduction histidine kinase
VEELASNGLRHGRPPVQVTVTAAGSGWLLEVRDTATGRPPAPAVDRDAALGGMGLHLVARLSRAHGWAVDGDGKIVWAHIGYRPPVARPSPQRIRAATGRARDLVAGLAVTEARIAVTLQRLAADAEVEGRAERARAYRAAAERAQRDAEQARRMSLHTLPTSGRADRRLGSSPGPVLDPVDRVTSSEPVSRTVR